ncbi:unnamed protein product [Effrenium voratum]|nr:unnamed protein product [Effrenium voratum]
MASPPCIHPNLASSWKPVSPDVVKPTLLLEDDKEPQFAPDPKKVLTGDSLEAILVRRDQELSQMLEDWMERLQNLLNKKSEIVDSAHLPPPPPKKRDSHKVTVRVRTSEFVFSGAPGAAEEHQGPLSIPEEVSFVEDKVVRELCPFNIKVEKRDPEEGNFHYFHRLLQDLVSSWAFEMLFAAVIVTNSIFIAVQVEVAASSEGADSSPAFFMIASVYTFLFTSELLLRIVARGPRIFCGEDWAWMILDLLIVISSVFEFVIEVLVQTNEEGNQSNVLTNMRLLRILRIAKITRAFRIVRLVRFIRSLRTLLLCIGRTLRAMAWSGVLLGLIIFLFGLIFTDICTEYLAREAAEQDAAAAAFLAVRCGSLEESMHTLYASITGGLTWVEARDAFQKISPLWGILFEIYIAFCNFAVLNVMTGVFCQSAIESAEKDHELNLESVSNEKEKYIRAVRRLFTQLDENSDGGITRREFERAWDDPVLQTIFDALEITSTDAWNLFAQLDRDGSGEVDVDEFLEGCMKVKGPARSIDVMCLQKDVLALRQRLGYV